VIHIYPIRSAAPLQWIESRGGLYARQPRFAPHFARMASVVRLPLYQNLVNKSFCFNRLQPPATSHQRPVTRNQMPNASDQQSEADDFNSLTYQISLFDAGIH
jgi:hypothetical protein